MRFSSIFVGTISLGQIAGAVRLHNTIHENNGLVRRGTEKKTEFPLKTEYIDLPIDHFGNDVGTFKNRYWVQTVEYRPGGPVFIYDAGESGVSPGEVEFVLNELGFFMDMVKKFNGIGILWEHRYYGDSTPYPVNVDTTSEQMQYLTAQQALADVPIFAWNFSRPEFPTQDLTPAGTPWVFVGGSYPGMRAAFIRNMYPETIFASYASSAPVQASINMSFYFEPIWQGMNAYGWGNCTQDIKAAVQLIDVQLESNKSAQQLKEKFLGAGAGENSNGGFADALATIFSWWQNYDMSASPDVPGSGLSDFCNWIEVDPQTNQTASAQGWSATKGAQYVIDRWASWPAFVPLINKQDNLTCLGPNPTKKAKDKAAKDGVNCDITARVTQQDSISWMWQYCTQWGFFQSANVGPHQLLSKYTDLDHWRDACHSQFPDGIESGYLPDWPLADKANQELGGWDIRPSNTFWVGNQYDPWRTLTPLSNMPFSNHVKASNNIPACTANGPTTLQEDYLFGYLVPDGEHCYDFDITFAPGAGARQLFDNALTEWLKCFTPGKGKKPDSLNGDQNGNGNDDNDDAASRVVTIGKGPRPQLHSPSS